MALNWTEATRRRMSRIHKQSWAADTNRRRTMAASTSQRNKRNWRNLAYRAKRSKYGMLGICFPKELAAFVRMHKRVAGGYTTTAWQRTRDGFLKFLRCVGPIPISMRQPSLGRNDHRSGYVPDNCGWQELYANQIEPLPRRMRNKYGQFVRGVKCT